MSVRAPWWAIMITVAGVSWNAVGAPWFRIVRVVPETPLTVPGVSCGWTSAAGAADGDADAS